jgi:hypothetical protein
VALKDTVSNILTHRAGGIIMPATEHLGGWQVEEHADGSVIVRWKYESAGAVWAAQQRHLRTIERILCRAGYSTRLEWLNQDSYRDKEPYLIVRH